MPPRRRNRRETTPASGDGNAPEGLANALGHIFQQLTAALPGSRTDFTMERARKHGAYSFSHAPNAMDAQNWLNKMERVFTQINCPEDRKVGLAVDFLDGVAFDWWNMTSRDLENDGPITWEQFKEHFTGRYYGTAIRDRMKYEFLHLEKGDKTVTEFEQRFTQLAQFVPDLVGTERERIYRFVDGLGGDYRLQLTGVPFNTYSEVVNAALRLETMYLSGVRPRDAGGPSQGPSKRAASTSGSGSSGGGRRVSSDSVTLSDFGGLNMGGGQSEWQFSDGTSQYGGTSEGFHTWRDRPQRWTRDVTCYQCGQQGHYRRDCPTLTHGVTPDVGQGSSHASGGSSSGTPTSSVRGGTQRGSGRRGRPTTQTRLHAMFQREDHVPPYTPDGTIFFPLYYFLILFHRGTRNQ
ncbi:uncharacterized protein LOC133711492 [Rosa rugosa]|uniref:uncharacterized protein LOC133711492 n=1 Tax=Rosa rugosa TaxID=74645 RepID=UPI002B407193|nr:uncharacterized protein LOC133711492 [Rosa rugosa]